MRVTILIMVAILMSGGALSNEINTTAFHGKYRLIKAVKETENHLTVRGSKCRESLEIKLSSDTSMLMLFGENVTKVGSTMNWIELKNQEHIETASTETLLKQTRTGFGKILGIEKRYDLTTTLEIDESHLSLKYEEKQSSLFSPKGKIVNASECLYELSK